MNKALLDCIAAKMVLFLGSGKVNNANLSHPTVYETGAGEFTVTLHGKITDTTYQVWTETDSDVSNWIADIFNNSHNFDSGTSSIWLLANLTHYPNDFVGFTANRFEELANFFSRSPRNLKVMVKSNADSLNDYLRSKDRVVVCTPYGPNGDTLVLEYYEPSDVQADGVALPEYLGLIHSNPDGSNVCVYAHRISVSPALTDKPQPVNKSFQQRTNEIMAKQKKVKSDHLLDEFMQAVLHLGDGTTTEVSKDSSGFTHVTCGTLSYRFTRCNSTVHAITQIADMIADDGCGVLKYPLAIYQDQCFGSRGKPQLLNQKRTVIKHLSDKLTARDINASLSSSYEVVGNLPNFSIKLALSATPEIIFIEVYAPHSFEDDTPIIIVTVDLKSMGCLMAFMQMDEQSKQSATLPWEDEPLPQGSVSQNWVSNNPKPEQKPGTLFLLEQNGDDDRQRINSVRKRLANTFNTLEVDICAELQLQEKLSDNHPPLMEQIRRILLQGKSVAVIWRSDAITGELSSLSNFATKVLEWVEMARTIKAPHYYIGNF